MRPRGARLIATLALAAAASFPAGSTRAQTSPGAAPKPTPPLAPLRDGQRDFDFLIGKWKYHLKRLENPLTGSRPGNRGIHD